MIAAVGAGGAISIWAAPALAAMVGIAGEVGGVLAAEVALSVTAGVLEGAIVGLVTGDQDEAFEAGLISAVAGGVLPVFGKIFSRLHFLFKRGAGLLTAAEEAEELFLKRIYLANRLSTNAQRYSPEQISIWARQALGDGENYTKFVDDIVVKGDDDFVRHFAEFTESSVAIQYLKGYGAAVNESFAIRTNIQFLESYRWLDNYSLFQNMGSASEVEIMMIHRYTVEGNFLNDPMRKIGSNWDEVNISPITWPEDFNRDAAVVLNRALAKLRSSGRLNTDFLFRGRTYNRSTFRQLFEDIPVGENVPLKSYVSMTTERGVAEHFTELSGSYIPASDRVKVIMKIKSKNGISIDDLSDWGGTLGPVRHSDRPIIEQRQFEVLSQEGYFRKSSSPTLIKVDREGVEWYEVILEETGIPLRDIP
jgi:hypothetical protein